MGILSKYLVGVEPSNPDMQMQHGFKSYDEAQSVLDLMQQRIEQEGHSPSPEELEQLKQARTYVDQWKGTQLGGSVGMEDFLAPTIGSAAGSVGGPIGMVGGDFAGNYYAADEYPHMAMPDKDSEWYEKPFQSLPRMTEALDRTLIDAGSAGLMGLAGRGIMAIPGVGGAAAKLGERAGQQWQRATKPIADGISGVIDKHLVPQVKGLKEILSPRDIKEAPHLVKMIDSLVGKERGFRISDESTVNTHTARLVASQLAEKYADQVGLPKNALQEWAEAWMRNSPSGQDAFEEFMAQRLAKVAAVSEKFVAGGAEIHGQRAVMKLLAQEAKQADEILKAKELEIFDIVRSANFMERPGAIGDVVEGLYDIVDAGDLPGMLTRSHSRFRDSKKTATGAGWGLLELADEIEAGVMHPSIIMDQLDAMRKALGSKAEEMRSLGNQDWAETARMAEGVLNLQETMVRDVSPEIAGQWAAARAQYSAFKADQSALTKLINAADEGTDITASLATLVKKPELLKALYRHTDVAAREAAGLGVKYQKQDLPDLIGAAYLVGLVNDASSLSNFLTKLRKGVDEEVIAMFDKTGMLHRAVQAVALKEVARQPIWLASRAGMGQGRVSGGSAAGLLWIFGAKTPKKLAELAMERSVRESVTGNKSLVGQIARNWLDDLVYYQTRLSGARLGRNVAPMVEDKFLQLGGGDGAGSPVGGREYHQPEAQTTGYKPTGLENMLTGGTPQ